MKKISVIIPSYNESRIISSVILEITTVLKSLAWENYEIIIVDDHSSDSTLETIKDLSNPNIRCIRLSRNSGSHIALRAGLSIAKGDVTLCISADGQDDPWVLPKMLDIWKSEKKIVWAMRKNRDNESFFVRFSAKIFYACLLWAVGVKEATIDFSRADFCLLDRRVVDAINSCPERNTSLFGLIAWLGFSQGTVEYDRRLRKAGRSKWTLRNRLRLAKDWIIAFSGLPLKMVSWLGLIIAVLGIIYAGYIVAQALFIYPALGWRSIPAWSSIIAAILILGGTQVIILGVIGEYLWRNLDESRRRPLYFIEDTCQET